jgi:hypothetical protein
MSKRENTEAIRSLKTQIHELIAKKWGLRVQLGRLQGPETGPERHQLKQDYNWGTRPVARATYLAYGLLRGRTYKQIEAKCEQAPDPYRIMKILHAVQESFKEKWTLEAIQKWIEGKEEAATEEQAA